MNPHPFALPSPDVIELLDLPVEFFGVRPAADDHQARQAEKSVKLARRRQEALEVVHLDNPRTTTFALFL